MNLFDDQPAPGAAADPLAALGVLDPAEHVVRPVTDVVGRAYELRRARRARTAVLGAAASVALVGSVVLLLPGGTATTAPSATTTPVVTTTPPATTASPVDCAAVSNFVITEQPRLLHLISGAGAPRVSSASGTDLPGGVCDGTSGTPTAAVRARFAADGSAVTAGLVVTGPSDAEVPYSFDPAGPPPTPGFTPTETPSPGGGGVSPGPRKEAVTVHGAEATLWRWTGPSPVLVTSGTAFLQWREPSTGKWWVVQASGLTRDEVVALAERLGTGGDRLDDATVPGTADGWTTLPVGPAGRAGHRFDSSYEVGNDMSALDLSVSDVPQYGPELVGEVSPGAVKVADVGGAQALLRPIGVDGDSPSLQWSKDGLWFVLQSGPGVSFDELVAYARKVTPVPADDPRVVEMVAAWKAYLAGAGATAGATATPTPADGGPSATATPAPSGAGTGDPVTPTVTLSPGYYPPAVTPTASPAPVTTTVSGTPTSSS